MWAAADLWARRGKRLAFSPACPQETALARSGGDRRSRRSTNSQHRLGIASGGQCRLLDLERRIPARDRFAPDFLLERNGFELPVPRENGYRSESSGFVYHNFGMRAAPTSAIQFSYDSPLEEGRFELSVPRRIPSRCGLPWRGGSSSPSTMTIVPSRRRAPSQTFIAGRPRAGHCSSRHRSPDTGSWHYAR